MENLRMGALAILVLLLFFLLLDTALGQEANTTYVHDGVLVCVPNTDYIPRTKLYEEDMAWKRYKIDEEYRWRRDEQGTRLGAEINLRQLDAILCQKKGS